MPFADFYPGFRQAQLAATRKARERFLVPLEAVWQSSDVVVLRHASFEELSEAEEQWISNLLFEHVRRKSAEYPMKVVELNACTFWCSPQPRP